KEPFLLVTHMDGSHYPYAAHSPLHAKKFLPEGDANSINAYDNTLVYTDMYLQRLEKELRSRFKDSWIFYTSDHGQNLDGQYGRFASGYSEQMIHNPLFIFPPENYFETLEANAHAPITQSDIFS